MSDLERDSRILGPDYTVVSVVAQPPFGRVLTARRHEQLVTVTLLDHQVVERLRDPAAFVDTMHRVAVVRHPALAPIVDTAIATNGAPFYAVEASDAPTGHERIVGGRLPSAHEVASAGQRIADALAALHDDGFVHGLIEPDRIRFAATGARLEDAGFYLALHAAGLDADAILELARPGVYLSPEQQSGAQPDSRSDVYGLGAALYELLTGKPPFGGRTTTMVMASVLADEPAVSVDAESQAPGHVVDAILRALEKAPDDRWSSAREFADALAADAPATSQPAPASARAGCMPIVMFTAVAASLALHAIWN